MKTDPASGTSRPAMERSSVVLPQPDGPKNERIPFSNLKLTLSRALTSLNVLLSPSTFSIAMLYLRPILPTPILSLADRQRTYHAFADATRLKVLICNLR